jgi:hypothetical protein
VARRGGKAKGDEEGPQISPEERVRIAKAAQQIPAYANFLRWTANFQKDEVTQHPKHERVILLSPMQSGRFSFSLEGDTLYLGVQGFEAVWLATMPFAKAYISDRLYLCVEGVACMDSRLPPLALGIFVDDLAKRRQMAPAKWLQSMRVRVSQGRVLALDGTIGPKVPLSAADIIPALAARAQNKLREEDISRFL